MPLRVMVYIGLLYLELYETKQFTKDPKTGYPQLPPILPLVLYNGKTRWNKALDVSDLIIKSPLGLEPFCPSMRYLLIDEGRYKKSLQPIMPCYFKIKKPILFFSSSTDIMYYKRYALGIFFTTHNSNMRFIAF